MDEATDREVSLETFRQTRAVKWLLAVLVGFVVLVVAVVVVSAYREEQERQRICASTAEVLDNPIGDSPSLRAERAALERQRQALC